MTCIIQHNNNNTTIANICSEFAKDEGVGDALVVENDNDPRDALAQQVDLVIRHTVKTSKFIL